MQLSEVIPELYNQKKITRENWKGEKYLFLVNGAVHHITRARRTYLFTDDFIISNGWVILSDPTKKEHNFSEIIEELLKGEKIAKSEWNDEFIYLDRVSGELVNCYSYSHPDLILTVQDLFAKDWIMLEVP